MKIIKNNLEIYNEKAGDWWRNDSTFYELRNFNPPRFRYFDQKIPSWNGLEVIDIGCGGGLTSEFLAEKGAFVTGIDLSQKSIEEARKHALKRNLSIQYKQGRAENLPYHNEAFDVAICVDVLEHVDDVYQVLSEINRVLKPGGFLFFDTINKTFLSKIVMIWLLEYVLKKLPMGLHDWEKFIPPQSLIKALESTGFSEVEIKGFDIRGKDKKTGALKVKINNNTSIVYIGTAKK